MENRELKFPWLIFKVLHHMITLFESYLSLFLNMSQCLITPTATESPHLQGSQSSFFPLLSSPLKCDWKDFSCSIDSLGMLHWKKIEQML